MYLPWSNAHTKINKPPCQVIGQTRIAGFTSEKTIPSVMMLPRGNNFVLNSNFVKYYATVLLRKKIINLKKTDNCINFCSITIF
jgi:hypothetical protein